MTKNQRKKEKKIEPGADLIRNRFPSLEINQERKIKSEPQVSEPEKPIDKEKKTPTAHVKNQTKT